MTKWLSIGYWKFLLERPFSIKKFFCRANGHPNGVIWFTSTGLEPNMHCVDCHDDLG